MWFAGPNQSISDWCWQDCYEKSKDTYLCCLIKLLGNNSLVQASSQYTARWYTVNIKILITQASVSRPVKGGGEWNKERKTDRQEQQHMLGEKTYSGSLHRPTVHKGDSRTGLDWAPPVAKESKEQLWDGAAAVVRLQERRGREERGGERFTAQLTMKTGDYAEIK